MAYRNIQDYKLLLIEDHQLAQKLLSVQLDVYGFKHIDTASNGVEGLKKIRENSYDIVMLDWVMPEKTGLEVIEDCAAAGEMDKTAFVMVSAEAQPDKILKVIEAGAISFITKPIKQDEFNEKMNRVIEWLDKRQSA